MTDARLVLICGLPGSGKTTVAKQLETEMPAVRMCPDERLHELGFEYKDPGARDRIEQEMWQESQELLKQRQNVVLEYGFWSKTDRDKMRLGARALGVAVELRYLDVSTDELWQRLEARNTHPEPGTPLVTRKDLEKWVGWLEVPDAAELALFDRSKV